MLKKIQAILLSLLLPCLIFNFGCFDVGDVKNEAEYCEVFSHVVMITYANTVTYDMDKFYNEETVNDLTSPAPADSYFYFCVELGNDFTGDDMGLHCKLDSGQGSIVTVEGFTLTKDEYVALINEEKKELPFSKISFGSATVSLMNTSKWSSFTLDNIGKVEKGGYIVLRFNEVVKGSVNLKFLITAPVIRVSQRG